MLLFKVTHTEQDNQRDIILMFLLTLLGIALVAGFALYMELTFSILEAEVQRCNLGESGSCETLTFRL
jgi:hypothetical protein